MFYGNKHIGKGLSSLIFQINKLQDTFFTAVLYYDATGNKIIIKMMFRRKLVHCSVDSRYLDLAYFEKPLISK